MSRATVFVLIEGLGWELMERSGLLADLAPHRYRLRTVLGGASATVPTLLTGMAPCDHGHWMPFSYSPGESPFRRLRLLRHLPSHLTSSGPFRRALARLLARRLGWTCELDLLHVPIALLPELDCSGRRALFEPGGMSPAATAIDRVHHERVPSFVGSGPRPDAELVSAAAGALGRGDARFVLVHLRELVAALHRAGPSSEEGACALAQCDDAVRALHRAAADAADEVRLYVGTDRGLTEVTETVDIRRRVEAAGLVLGRDYFAFYDPTMVRLWFADAASRHHLMASIADVGRGRWLGDDQLRLEGVYFHDHRYGEALFLLEPGLAIAPSYHSAEPLAAVGGYHPTHVGSWAGFCSSVRLGIPPALVGDLSALIVEGARWAAG